MTRKSTRKNDDIVPYSGRQLSRRDLFTSEDPLARVFEDFRNSFNQLLEPLAKAPWFTDPIFPLSLSEAFPSKSPVVDMIDKGDHYIVTAELPGFEKNNIDVRIADDVLQVTARKESENEKKGEKYVSHERAFSSFRRAIQFPEQVIAEKVQGTMKNGVLELKIPKKEPTSTRLTKVALK